MGMVQDMLSADSALSMFPHPYPLYLIPRLSPCSFLPCRNMKFTSGFLYGPALVSAVATVQARDCSPNTDSYGSDGEGSDDTSAGSDTYQVENSC